MISLVVLLCLEPWDPERFRHSGEEILISYGDHSALQFIYAFGFLPLPITQMPVPLKTSMSLTDQPEDLEPLITAMAGRDRAEKLLALQRFLQLWLRELRAPREGAEVRRQTAELVEKAMLNLERIKVREAGSGALD